MEDLTIGILAKKAGVNVETIRYYEQRGLIQQPRKPHAGYRRYAADLIDRIRFIKHAQELGFTLSEIIELLALRVEPTTACNDVKDQAEAKIADITEKIKALQRMKKTLISLVNACDKRASTAECPILEALK